MKIYLVLFLIIIVALLLIIRATQPPTQQPTPAIKEDPKFTLLSNNIPNKLAGVTDTFIFVFDKPVDNESLAIEIVPNHEILPKFNQSLTTLTIQPTNAWNFDTIYTIRILQSTKSKDGLLLDKDYTFEFKTVPYSGI